MRLSEIEQMPVRTDDAEPTHYRLGDLMSLSRIPESTTITAEGLFDVDASQRNEWRQRGKIGFMEQWRRQDKTEMIPLNPERAVKSVQLFNAVNRLRSGQSTDEQRTLDQDRVSRYLLGVEEERARGFTIGGRVMQGVAELPGFIVEFLATGGAAALGKRAVKETATRLAGEFVERGALNYAVRGAGVAAGAAVRTAAMPHRIVETFADRQTRALLELTDKGIQLAAAISERPYTSVMKAIGDVWIENVSEVTGPAMGAAGARLIPPSLRSGVLRLWQRLHPNEPVSKLLTQAGWHGFLSEMGEERVGDFLRAVTGVDDFGTEHPERVFDRVIASIPNGEELLVEAGVLAFPGGVALSAHHAVELIQRRKQEDGVIEPTLRELDASTVERLAAPPPTTTATAAPAPTAEPVADVVQAGTPIEQGSEPASAEAAPIEAPVTEQPEPVLTEPEFEQAVTETEQAQAQLSETERAAELEIERELLQEMLTNFRERVGVMRRPAGDFLKEELSQIPKSYFTKDPNAPSIDEQAANLGFEGINELVEAISTFERLKPERMQRLKDVTQAMRELRKTMTGKQQAVAMMRQMIVRRIKGRLPSSSASAQRLAAVPLSRLREALVQLRASKPASPEDAERLLQPLLTPQQTRSTTDDYARNRLLRQQRRPASMVRRVVADVQMFVDQAFVPVSTRLANINESLRHRLRRFDFDVNTKTQADLKRVEPLLKQFAKLPQSDFADLDFALKNRDEAKVSSIVSAHRLQSAFQAVRDLLDDLYQRAQQVGLDLGYLEQYFPRRVRDTAAFLDFLRQTEGWSAIEEAIRFREAELGVVMSPEDRVQFINLLIRGTAGSPIRLSIPGHVKERLIDRITPEMNQFYKPSSAALVDYVTAMNNAIEQRRFFGNDATTLDQSIGAYIDRLVHNGEIQAADEQRVRNILKARFEQHGATGMIRLYKNLSYIYTMGSPISAITQIGDLAFALYENGYYETGRILGRSIVGKTVLAKEDLGLSRIAEEFTGESASAKAVSQMFRLIGLEKIDAIGKNALIQGAWDRLTTSAKTDASSLTSDLQPIFGEETAAVVSDLQQGRVSDNVKYLLFSELADVQPVSLSEMPEEYLRGGNWRILYMLKTYTLKLLDVYHNEVGRQMKTDPAKALGNLVRLTTALMLMGAASDEIKDFLLGRPKDFSEVVMDNLLKLLGFNKWHIYKVRKEGLHMAFMQSIAPPAPFFDDLFRDVVGQRDLPDWRIWGRVPLVGKFYYWWFGGGTLQE